MDSDCQCQTPDMDFATAENDAEREAMAEAMLELLTLWRSMEFDEDQLALIATVTLSRIRRKPMDLTKISRTTGIPRATLLRKFDFWQRRGVRVHRYKGRHYPISDKKMLQSEESLRLWNTQADVFLRTAAKIAQARSKGETADLHP